MFSLYMSSDNDWLTQTIAIDAVVIDDTNPTAIAIADTNYIGRQHMHHLQAHGRILCVYHAPSKNNRIVSIPKQTSDIDRRAVRRYRSPSSKAMSIAKQ